MTPDASLAATAIGSWNLWQKRAETVFLHRTDEQLQQRVAPGKNRVVYLLGHLLAVHDAMLPLLGIGERRYPELDAVFLAAPDDHASPLRSAEDLRAMWAEVHGALAAGFAGFTPHDWTKRHTAMTDADFAANPLRNRAAVLLNRAGHMAFHVGQCALIEAVPD